MGSSNSSTLLLQPANRKDYAEAAEGAKVAKGNQVTQSCACGRMLCQAQRRVAEGLYPAPLRLLRSLRFRVEFRFTSLVSPLLGRERLRRQRLQVHRLVR